jgi:hypothetical protein
MIEDQHGLALAIGLGVAALIFLLVCCGIAVIIQNPKLD